MAETVNSLSEFTHIIIVLTEINKESKKLLNKNIEVIALSKKEGNGFYLWGKLFKLFFQIKPDILHSYNLPTLEYQLLGFLTRIPVRIHAEHGRYASDPEGTNKKYRLLRRIIDPFIHYWIPVSADLSEWLEYFISIPKEKIRLIYNGVDTDHFTPLEVDKNTLRLEGFATHQDIVLGTVGRLDPVKNQKILIETYNILVKKKPILIGHLKVVIIGSGPLEDELFQLINIQKLENEIWLPGARYNIRELLNSIDIFLLPSIAEGIPMTLLEAMSMKKPVIASAVGGIPEVLGNSAGVIVKPNDAEALAKSIMTQLENIKKCKEMGGKARKHIISNFSLTAMIEQYSKLYLGNVDA